MLFCAQCGWAVSETAGSCSHCGAGLRPAVVQRRYSGPNRPSTREVRHWVSNNPVANSLALVILVCLVVVSVLVNRSSAPDSNAAPVATPITGPSALTVPIGSNVLTKPIVNSPAEFVLATSDIARTVRRVDNAEGTFLFIEVTKGSNAGRSGYVLERPNHRTTLSESLDADTALGLQRLIANAENLGSMSAAGQDITRSKTARDWDNTSMQERIAISAEFVTKVGSPTSSLEVKRRAVQMERCITTAIRTPFERRDAMPVSDIASGCAVLLRFGAN
jgi:hypothetical protein